MNIVHIPPVTFCSRGQILGRNLDKFLRVFPPCYSQSPLLTDFNLSPSPLSKCRWKLVCNANIVHRNYKSENSQDYAQRPQRNCTFMNSASDFAGSARYAYNKKNEFRFLFWKALFCQEEQRGQPYTVQPTLGQLYSEGTAIWYSPL